MAAVTVSDLVGVASLIRDLVSAGYEDNKEWENFSRDVKFLEGKSHLWTRLVNENQGGNSFRVLESAVKEANGLYEKEKTKLEKRRQHNYTYNVTHKVFRIGKRVLVPTAIGYSINRVKQAFDDVYRTLRDEIDAISAFQEKILFTTPRPHNFRTDKRYVRLESREVIVQSRLAAADYKFVLLHGESGRGKSSLAINLLLQIQSRGQDERVPGPPSDADAVAPRVAQDHASTSRSSQFHTKFDEGIFLDCGPDRDIQAIQGDFLDHLGYWRDVTKKLDLQAVLTAILPRRKLLVILDNVCKPEILQEMLDLADCAPNVKFLVTSHDAGLCGSLNLRDFQYEPVSMNDIGLSDARDILARHISYRDRNFILQRIPQHVEEHADDIIRIVGGNILAIACVATGLNGNEVQNEEEWKKVKEELLRLLKSEDIALIQSVKYPRSYFAAIQLSVNRLHRDEQMLLVLTAIFRERSVSEGLVEYLYKWSKSEHSFSKSKRTLQAQKHVQIHENVWSIHLLRRIFVDEMLVPTFKRTFLEGLSKDNMGANKLEMYIKLEKSTKSEASNETEENIESSESVLSAICILYLMDQNYAQEIAKKMQAENIINVDHDQETMIQRSHVIREISILAAQEQSKDWTRKLQFHSRKVFLKYVREGVVDEEGAVFLLYQFKRDMDAEGRTIRLYQYKPVVAMVEIYFEILSSSMKSVPTGSVLLGEGIIPPLLVFLTSIHATCTQDHLYGTGGTLVDKIYALIGLAVTSTTKLEKLSDDIDCSKLATSILVRLTETLTTCLTEDDHQGGVPPQECRQGEILSEDNHQGPILADNGPGWAMQLEDLSRQSTSHATRLDLIERFIYFSRILEVLTPSHDIERMQVSITRLVQKFANRFNLSVPFYLFTGHSHFGARVVPALCDLVLWGGQGRALLQTLAQALEKCETQMQSVHALLHLADRDTQLPKKFWLEICNEAVPIRVFLVRNKNLSLRFEAARARAPALMAEDGDEIVSESIAIIVGALGETRRPRLRHVVMRALARFASLGGSEVCEKLRRIPELTTNLLAALATKDRPEFKMWAAFVVGCLAQDADKTFCLVIANEASQNLFDALVESGNPSHQYAAATLLAVLAENGGGEVCEKLRSVPGSMTNLLDALATHDVALKSSAARAFATLVRTTDKGFHLEVPDAATPILVDALAKSGSPSLQNPAAEALCWLASISGEKVHKSLQETPGLIKKILVTMTNRESPHVQFWAIQVFTCLVNGGTQTFCIQVFQESIPILVDALKDSQNLPLPDGNTVEESQHSSLQDAGALEESPKLPFQDEGTLGGGQNLPLQVGGALEGVAARALAWLAKIGGEDVCEELRKTPGSVKSLVDALEKQNCPHRQVWAAQAFKCLVVNGKRDFCLEISKEYIPILVNALTKSRNPSFQNEAAQALVCLVINGGKGVCDELRRIPEYITNLRVVFTANECAIFRLSVTCVLTQLVRYADKTFCLETSKEATCILVDALVERGDLPLQLEVARALTCLVANGGEEVRDELQKSNGLIRNLLDAIANPGCPDLQYMAGNLLGLLVQHGEKEFCLEVSDESIPILILALGEKEDPRLQEVAAISLAELFRIGGDDVCQKLQMDAESFMNLSAAMANCDSGTCQLWAVRAFSLWVRNVNKEVLLGMCKKSIPILVYALAENAKPSLRIAAVSSLASLIANGSEEVCDDLRKTDGVIKNLVDAIAENSCPELQVEATALLANLLAYRDEVFFLKVATEATQVLLRALGEQENPRLQDVAAAALAGLVRNGGDDVCQEVRKEPESLTNLVAAMANRDHPICQHKAVAAFTRLVMRADKEFCLEISKSSIPILINLLAERDKPRVKEGAVYSLLFLRQNGGQQVKDKLQNDLQKAPLLMQILFFDLCD